MIGTTPLRATARIVALAAVLGCMVGLAQASEAKPSAATPTVSVDINSASADELASIPGIGQALASRIVEMRDKEGPFRKVEDLLKVKGIGEKSLEKLRPYVKIGKAG
jgi:competence protein ComEA